MGEAWGGSSDGTTPTAEVTTPSATALAIPEGLTRIPFSGLVLVGLSWLADHRLLVTTPSQIIVWDVSNTTLLD